MADLITWTTPTVTEAFDGINLTRYTGYVTIEQTAAMAGRQGTPWTSCSTAIESGE